MTPATRAATGLAISPAMTSRQRQHDQRRREHAERLGPCSTAGASASPASIFGARPQRKGAELPGREDRFPRYPRRDRRRRGPTTACWIGTGDPSLNGIALATRIGVVPPRGQEEHPVAPPGRDRSARPSCPSRHSRGTRALILSLPSPRATTPRNLLSLNTGAARNAVGRPDSTAGS